MNIKEAVANSLPYEDYEFLVTEPLLARTQLLYKAGSHAYGLNTESSDIDIRGVCIPEVKSLIMNKNFEQFENHNTDTTIYEIHKFISLLAAANPNIIEVLGLDKAVIVYETGFYQYLLDNSELFLSQLVSNTFGGYSFQQLNRIKNNMARHSLDEKEALKHTYEHINSQIDKNPYEGPGFLRLVPSTDIDDIVLDIEADNVGIREFYQHLSVAYQAYKDYNKTLSSRNKRKDDAHMSKHMSHLIRLYHMGSEILEGKGVITKRVDDHDLLMDIKNGKFTDDNGIPLDSFWDLQNEEEARFEYARKHSDLPKKPAYKKIDEFLYDVLSTEYEL